MTNSFLLCQPALCCSLPCRLTSAASSVTKQNEEALTLLPHIQDVLTFTPLFWWIPRTPEATQGGEYVQKMHKLVRKSCQYSCITNPGTGLKMVAAWGLPIYKHLRRPELCVSQGIWATPDAGAGRQLVLVASTCKVKRGHLMAVEVDRVASTSALLLAVSRTSDLGKLRNQSNLTQIHLGLVVLTSEFLSSVIWDDTGNFLDMRNRPSSHHYNCNFKTYL